MANDRFEILSIGHSQRSIEEFIALLRHVAVGAVADVRTAPYSKYYPHFNQDALKTALKQVGIDYVFLGKELGGRPHDNSFFCDGIADYEKMAETSDFQKGLNRLIEGSKTYRIAMVCSEREPLECHRCLLVGRALYGNNIAVRHIIDFENSIMQQDVEVNLLTLANKSHEDMFADLTQRISLAYRQQALKVAFHKA